MDIICYLCYKGCRIRAVDVDHINGAECEQGSQYAINELQAPTRELSTTVRTTVNGFPVVSVRTDKAVPKSEIFRILKLLNDFVLTEPKNRGDVIVQNVCGTDANVIVTTNMNRRIQ